MMQIKILFVCMGNICRSPTAHGVFEGLVKHAGLSDKIKVDSAGTHAYHLGEPPDHRAQGAALGRGYDLSNQRARRTEPEDFINFDYILAMDKDNYSDLSAICPDGMESKLHLFMDFAQGRTPKEVPDPYYGGPGGFERVFDLVETAAQGLLNEIKLKYPVIE